MLQYYKNICNKWPYSNGRKKYYLVGNVLFIYLSITDLQTVTQLR